MTTFQFFLAQDIVMLITIVFIVEANFFLQKIIAHPAILFYFFYTSGISNPNLKVSFATVYKAF